MNLPPHEMRIGDFRCSENRLDHRRKLYRQCAGDKDPGPRPTRLHRRIAKKRATQYAGLMQRVGAGIELLSIKKNTKKMVSSLCFERVILSAGAMLSVSVLFQIDQMPEGEGTGE
jgi:hypothetical protein